MWRTLQQSHTRALEAVKPEEATRVKWGVPPLAGAKPLVEWMNAANQQGRAHQAA